MTDCMLDLLIRDLEGVDGILNIEDLGEQIKALYSEDARYYHNFGHAFIVRNKSIELANKYLEGVSPKEKLELALSAWMHDYIYIPGSPTNEVDSAEAFLSLFKDASNIDLDKVAQMIIDTKEHVSEPETLTSCLMDADMFGLADPYDDFLWAGKLIRSEYRELDDEIWFNGRLNFFRGVLNTKIYANCIERETPAKTNIRRSMKELEEKLKKT